MFSLHFGNVLSEPLLLMFLYKHWCMTPRFSFSVILSLRVVELPAGQSGFLADNGVVDREIDGSEATQWWHGLGQENWVTRITGLYPSLMHLFPCWGEAENEYGPYLCTPETVSHYVSVSLHLPYTFFSTAQYHRSLIMQRPFPVTEVCYTQAITCSVL